MKAETETEKETCVYSRTFIIKCKTLDICKQKPEEINCITNNIKLINISEYLKNERNKKLLGTKDNVKWVKTRGNSYKQIETLTKTLNPWKGSDNPPDIKRITGILNKLSEDNFDKLVTEVGTFNYCDPGVIKIIFRKVTMEPFFSTLYAKFCNKLVYLHQDIIEMCRKEFDLNKNKNVAEFISELYKIGLLKDLNYYTDVLIEYLTEKNLEILHKIIITVGIKNPMFSDIIKYLDSVKSSYSSRYKFMILDLTEIHS